MPQQSIVSYPFQPKCIMGKAPMDLKNVGEYLNTLKTQLFSYFRNEEADSKDPGSETGFKFPIRCRHCPKKSDSFKEYTDHLQSSQHKRAMQVWSLKKFH